MKQCLLPLLFVGLMAGLPAEYGCIGISSAQIIDYPPDPGEPPPWPQTSTDERYQVEGFDLVVYHWGEEAIAPLEFMAKGEVRTSIDHGIQLAKRAMPGGGAYWGGEHKWTWDWGEWVSFYGTGFPMYYYARGAIYWYYVPK